MMRNRLAPIPLVDLAEPNPPAPEAHLARGKSVADEAAPYEALVRMIEHELELVTEGRLAEFKALNDERDGVMAKLLEAPPASAMAALERAELMHKRLAIELERRREQLLLAVSALERARRAARGYKPASDRTPRFTSSA